MNPIEIDVVVAHVDVDSMQPVFFNDEIAVQTTVEKIENKSFTLCQRIIDLKNNVEKCVCRTVMAGFDFKNNCTKTISEQWRKDIEEYKNN
ncbi:MAG: hypothetical protein KBA02_04165 [Paludibacteraceae bacterium]|nr:hypothetical protein [Paludibacteraceae bacterium]